MQLKTVCKRSINCNAVSATYQSASNPLIAPVGAFLLAPAPPSGPGPLHPPMLLGMELEGKHCLQMELGGETCQLKNLSLKAGVSSCCLSRSLFTQSGTKGSETMCSC